MFAATMHAEKPFDFATTPGKLPKEVVPTEYSIRIVPNIDKLTFTGTETVKVSVRAPHSRNLAERTWNLKLARCLAR